MHTFLVGQILEVRPTSWTNKTSGEVTSNVDVTIQSTLKDKDGFNIFTTETISFPFDMKPKFDSLKGRFIGIPYRYSSFKDKSFLIADTSVNYLVFDENPFVEKAKK